MADITPKIVKVKDLVPYENNHRVISQEAINAVASSIKAYGYNVPILIDENNVIIAGHVRREALLKLKVKEVACMVIVEEDEVEKDKMRLLDNAIGEAANWNELKLGQELRMIKEIGSQSSWDTFSSMFGEGSALDNLLDNSLGNKIADVTEGKMEKAVSREADKFAKERTNKNDREVKCPKCGSEFKIRVYDA